MGRRLYPSKASLESSHLYREAKYSNRSQGIESGGLELALSQMLDRKDRVVSKLAQGIGYSFKKNNVETLTGVAKIEVLGEVSVDTESGNEVVVMEYLNQEGIGTLP